MDRVFNIPDFVFKSLQEFKAEDPCYLGFDVAQEKDQNSVCAIVVQRMSDGTILVVEQFCEFVKGDDFITRHQKTHELLKKITKKYNCAVITAIQKNNTYVKNISVPLSKASRAFL